MDKITHDYSSLFYLLPFPSWIYDLETFQIHDVNQAAIDHYGYSKEEFFNLTIEDLHRKKPIPKLFAILSDYDNNIGNIYFGVFDHQKRSGEHIRMKINGYELIFQGRKSVLLYCQDVTREERKDKLLKESEEKLKAASAISKLGYWRIELEMDTLSWTDEIFQIWGRRREEFELNYENIYQTIHPDDQETFAKEHLKYFDGEEEHEFVHRIILPDNSIRWVHELGRLIYDESGKLIAFEGTVQDITARKEEEQRLKLLESVITNSNDAILITEAEPFDEPGPKIIYVNEAFTKMTGYEAEEVIGRSPRFLQGPNSNKEELSNLGGALRKWEPYEITTVNYKKTGEEYWVNFTVIPVANESGWYTHWIAIERDVTKQKNKAREKELLGQISLNFNSENEYVTAARNVCQTIGRFGAYDLVELWTTNLENRMQLLAHYVENPEDDAFYTYSKGTNVFEILEGMPGKVWADRKQLLWSDVDQSKKFIRNEAAKKIGLKSVMGNPLISHGEVVGVLVIGSKRDINFIKKNAKIFERLENYLGSEINRKKLENDLSHLYEAIPDILCMVDFEGKFLKMNKAGYDILGYCKEEILLHNFEDFVHPKDKEISRNEFMKLVEGKSTFQFENRYRAKSGEIVWLSWTCNASEGEGVIFASAKNITAEKKLRELNRHASILARIGSWELDLLQDKLYWSDMVYEIHETDPDNFVGDYSSGISFYREDFQPMIQSLIDRCKIEGKGFDFEAILVTAKKNERWVRSIGNVDIVDGQCLRIFGSIQDIDDRKKAAEDLKVACEDKDAILDSIGDVFFSVNKDWEVTYWNKEAENVLGKSRESILGKNLWQEFSNAVPSNFYRKIHQAFESQKNVTFEVYYPILKNWFEVSAYPTDNNLSVYLKEITLRKKADTRLVEANERFERVTEATNEAIWDWDFVNKKYYRSNGIDTILGEEIHKSLSNKDLLLNKFHPEDLPLFQKSLHQAIIDPFSTRWESEYRLLNYKGDIVYIKDRAQIIRDNSGKAIRMVGAMADITSLKIQEIELKELNESLSRSACELERSNYELKHFTIVASHDLQEPLRMISSYIYLLKNKYGEELDEKAHQYIHFASDGAQRMKQIILDLLDYSRAGSTTTSMEEVNLNEMLKDFKQLRRRMFSDKEIHIESNELPILKTYKAVIFQILQCLLDNAIKFSKESTGLKIEILSKEKETEWEFSIKDNGIGIEPQFLDKIFVIFQKLNNNIPNEGTGMGLSIAKKHVEFLGGRIWVDSIPGEGSKFYFTIPKSEVKPAQKLKLV